MRSRPLPEETRLRFEALELLIEGRRMVARGIPIEKVAAAFDVSVEALLLIPPSGELSVEMIADFLDV